MLCLRRLVPSLILLAFMTSCGSGIVAIFSNDGGGTAPPPLKQPPPTPVLTTIHDNTAPLRKQDGELLWSASVQNYELPLTMSRIRVELRAFGDVVDVPPVVRVPDLTTVEFLYENEAIRTRAKDMWGEDGLETHDVAAFLAVLVDGVEVAKPIAITMLRAPTIEIQNQPRYKVLSPHGQILNTRIKSIALRPPTNGDPGSAAYTKDLINLNGVVAQVAFGRDLESRLVARIASATIEPSGDLRLAIAMPEVVQPIQGHLILDSVPSGRSSLVSNLFYRPKIKGASPATGASEGGTEVVLFGTALIPPKLDAPGQLDFDAITLIVRKGSRETVIARNKIKDISNSSTLFFAMPPAPDGRSGPADIELVVDIDAINSPSVTVSVKAEGVFTYGGTQPYFGPRGVQLPGSPVRVRYSPFVETKIMAVDAVSVTAGPGGVPYAAVLRTRGNGLFTRFGQPVRAALTNDQLQRHPVDICIADFVGDGTRSGLILNRGTGQFARHSFVIGSLTSNPPIAFNENLELSVEETGRACASGDLNGDNIADMVIVGTPQLGRETSVPVLFISDGQPSLRFKRSEFSDYDGPFDFEAVDVADIDGDEKLDVILAEGGATPRLLIAFGAGNGVFAKANVVDLVGRTLDLSAAGYTPSANSRVVGVHAIGVRNNRSIAMVFSGVAKSMASPPAVVHVRKGVGARTFDGLKSADILKAPGGERVYIFSAAGDLTNDAAAELAVVAAEDKLEPIRIFSRSSAGLFTHVKNAVDVGMEALRGVRGVAIGVSTAPGRHHQAKGRQALFVTHDQPLANATEYRVSTFLAEVSVSTPKVLSPHAARKIASPILGVTVGEFFKKSTFASGDDLDTWVAIEGGLISLHNDGLGELTAAKSTLTATNILPSTLTTVSAGILDDPNNMRSLPVFLTEDGQLGLVLPSDPDKVLFAGGATPVDLRTFAPDNSDPKLNLRLRTVKSNSVIKSADVDSDRIPDLVVMVGLAMGKDLGRESESLLLLLRGKRIVKPGEFPYELPNAKNTVGSLTHGNVSSIAIGDFVTTLTDNTLELVVALPLGGSLGNEVRFYRWDAKLEVFAHSFASGRHHALPVGNEPSLVVSDDYNRDGRADIAVASRGDDKLWIFFNFSSPTSGRSVDLTKFQGAPANPLPLPAGEPRQMVSADVNGDASPDVVLVVESGVTVKQQHVVYYVSPGFVAGSGLRTIPHERTGNYVLSNGSWGVRGGTVSLGLGDLNGDGAPDLVVGWDTAGTGDYNLRVLFSNNF